MYHNFEDQLLYSSSKVQFCYNIRPLISFYIYHRYFRIQYSYYCRNYLFFRFIIIFYSSVSKSVQISLIALSLISFFLFFDIKGFLILFFDFGLLNFFLLPYTVCFGVFILKRLITLFLKPLTLFLIGSGTQLISQSCQVFLIRLIFFIFFFKLIHVIYRHNNRFKNSSSIALLTFTSLSFNFLSLIYIKSFSNYKRLFFTFKNWFFCIFSFL